MVNHRPLLFFEGRRAEDLKGITSFQRSTYSPCEWGRGGGVTTFAHFLIWKMGGISLLHATQPGLE